MFLKIAITNILKRLPKTEVYFCVFEWEINHILSYVTVVTLQYDVIVNFPFQIIRSHWQRSLAVDRPCRLTASLQKKKHEI